MTTHTHQETTSRMLPFGGISLSTCTCGARRRSDGRPIVGGVLGTDGWYTTTQSNPREAYDLLQSEGYTDGPDAVDPEDEFDVPGGQ